MRDEKIAAVLSDAGNDRYAAAMACCEAIISQLARKRVGNDGYSQGYWDDASGNPLLDIQLAQDTMKANTAYRGKSLVFTTDVYNAIKQHPAFLDRIKYTQDSFVTCDLVAQAFGVDEVVVFDAVHNVVQQGQVARRGHVSRNCAMLCYTEKAPAVLEPTAMAYFSYVGDPRVNGLEGVVTSWCEPGIRPTMLEAACGFQHKVVANDFGIFFTNVLSE